MCSTIVEQACVYCTSNNRKCAKVSQELYNRLVCIVRVITVSVRSVLSNRGTGLYIVRVITVSVRSVLNNRGTGLCVLYE